jgi:hypothetical protein
MTSASASRVTRSRRSLQFALLLFAGVLAGVTVLRAQEAAPPPPAGTDASVQAGDKPDAAAGGADKDGTAPASDAATQPRSAVPAGSSPTRFEPTEKVRADFDVSFPIDI